MLEVKSISKKFEGKENLTVKNVSFELGEAEIMSIIGESGCGKTTLLRCLAGLHDLEEGEILLKGEKIKGPLLKLVPGHENIEMVFQNYELMPFHTVYENVRYKLIQYPESYQKERTLDVLRICQIEELKNEKPGNLSGGQQQRIALARAIANEPDLILLDEPFSNLDNMLRNSFRELIKRIVKTIKTSFIFVSHDTPDALALSDKIAIMHEGKFIQVGNPKEVYNHPTTEYSAQFFGNPNILSKEEIKKALNIEVQNAKNTIRPERIHLTKNDNASSKITASTYLGSYYEYELITKNNITLHVQSLSEFQIDDCVDISIDSKDITPLK